MTGLAQFRLAMGMKNMRHQSGTEHASTSTSEAKCSHRGGVRPTRGRSPVCQELYPRARILMSDHTRMVHVNMGVLQKGSVEAAVTPEPAVPCSFFWTFTARANCIGV